MGDGKGKREGQDSLISDVGNCRWWWCRLLRQGYKRASWRKMDSLWDTEFEGFVGHSGGDGQGAFGYLGL